MLTSCYTFMNNIFLKNVELVIEFINIQEGGK